MSSQHAEGIHTHTHTHTHTPSACATHCDLVRVKDLLHKISTSLCIDTTTCGVYTQTHTYSHMSAHTCMCAQLYV